MLAHLLGSLLLFAFIFVLLYLYNCCWNNEIHIDCAFCCYVALFMHLLGADEYIIACVIEERMQLDSFLDTSFTLSIIKFSTIHFLGDQYGMQ